jgi:catechol 1,2-dioxygenase
MIITSQDDVTSDALAAMERTADPRAREILVSLVKHLHRFIREVRLTEDEFRQATAVLNEIGRLSVDTHNETVLMAGSLGVSSLVCLLNNGDDGNAETSQSLLGPFWRLNSPRVANGGTIVRSDTPGDPLFVTGRVVDRAGNPVAGAEVNIWHASPIGLYENQDAEQADMNLRGKLTTDHDGRFWFATVRMVGYPIPTGGVVGRLLRAQNRHPHRPAHPARPDRQGGLQGADFSGLRSERPEHRHRPAVRRHQGASGRLQATRGIPSVGAPNPSALVFARPHLRHAAGRNEAPGAADQMTRAWPGIAIIRASLSQPRRPARL